MEAKWLDKLSIYHVDAFDFTANPFSQRITILLFMINILIITYL